MTFRKRNIALSRTGAPSDPASPTSTPTSPQAPSLPAPGTRPSPIDGRPTTSTGTPSLDGILAGHAGLTLGNSILIEETGTTDYAGSLLRFYAAEGVVQGHKVHVVGVPEGWGRELPGVVVGKEERAENKEEKEKMKIAWRYERLGEFGANRGAPAVNRTPQAAPGQSTGSSSEPQPFCHTFDLAKRLTLPLNNPINHIPIPLNLSPTTSPYSSILQNLQKSLSSSPPNTIHRLIIPTLLSPALYPQSSSQPTHILPFLHALRALLRQHATQLTALISLPLSLYPRPTTLTRWLELLSDSVIELSPFSHHMDSLSTSGAATAGEEKPMGMVRVHRLPVWGEKGGAGAGGGTVGNDLAFLVTRRRFVIREFSLPPAEGDREAQEGGGGAVEGKTKVDLEF